MSSNKFLVGSFAALSITFAGALAAQQNIQIHIYGEEERPNLDFGERVEDPTPDPRAQRKTERMLRERELQARDEAPVGRVTPRREPDMDKLQRTERMLRAQEEAAKDEPR